MDRKRNGRKRREEGDGGETESSSSKEKGEWNGIIEGENKTKNKAEETKMKENMIRNGT